MTSSQLASQTHLVLAPGRVNLLGEHVDYNDGPVLPAAINRTMKLAFAPLDSDQIELSALDLGKKTAFRIAEIPDKVDLAGNPLPDYALYPAGVAWALREAGLPVPGLRAAYTSNIPIGSGLSSSAAVEVGFARAFMALADWEMDPMDLVKLAQRAENQYVGVQSGIMDQFACLFGREDHALYLDTRSLAWEAVPLPEDVTIVVADSNLPRTLAGSAYNERRQSCEKAVALLSEHLPRIRALRDVSPDDFAAHASRLPQPIRKRARHVVEECARVDIAVPLLRAGDITGFGRLMQEGHASLRDLYEVSLPELDALVDLANGLPGCYGARLTGAGFGGCTVNLVRASYSQEFIQALERGYQDRTNRQASVYLCRAARGAHLAPAA
jgi:galactokinase